ncbi:uncharacterized protein LOC143038772 isoform X2 [Oratosquilla oratoria]|uniref:uncharacterized protein LOC143038772 isoform X2 n=1 Tax=Oratosquilla oratoria TaxID=337810 RepID=UPI003F76A2DF
MISSSRSLLFLGFLLAIAYHQAAAIPVGGMMAPDMGTMPGLDIVSQQAALQRAYSKAFTGGAFGLPSSGSASAGTPALGGLAFAGPFFPGNLGA